MITSDHVPSVLSELNGANGDEGWKLPVKGAVPEAIGVVAESFNTVFTKLSPEPPTLLMILTPVVPLRK